MITECNHFKEVGTKSDAEDFEVRKEKTAKELVEAVRVGNELLETLLRITRGNTDPKGGDNGL
jgi:hypothetical protein